MKKDLQELPKLRDSISYVYLEKTRIEQDSYAISFELDKKGKVHLPISSITCLLLGPGTSITHAAIKTITESGCLIVWCGENAERFYASGMGETKSSRNLLRQAILCMNEEYHMQVIRRMYSIRFPEMDTRQMSLQQIRGLEGIRVKQAYKTASKQFGVPWQGRNYKFSSWEENDPINRALSEANVILYSLCQAAIVTLGYSTGLGFIHTGKALSFVYDIADIYKSNTTIPAAFQAVATNPGDLSAEVRRNCRRYFSSFKILKRIASDIEQIFDIDNSQTDNSLLVGDLWDTNGKTQSGGKNYGGKKE